MSSFYGSGCLALVISHACTGSSLIQVFKCIKTPMGCGDDLGFFPYCVIMKNCQKILGKKFRNSLPQGKKYHSQQKSLVVVLLRKAYPL